MLSVGFYGACVALIGIAVGFLVRSTATAIGLLLGLLMLAPLLVDLVPGTVGETLSKIVPSNAGEAMMSVTSRDSLLSPMLGLAVLVAWVVGLLLAAVALPSGRMRPRPSHSTWCLPSFACRRRSSERAPAASFGAVEVAVIVVSATLVLLRHHAPIPVLAAAIGASIASVAVTDHLNVLIAVVVLVVFTVAAEHDRRTGVYAGLAGLAGLLVVVGIQNPRTSCPARCSQQWRGRRAVAAGDLLRTRRETIVAAEERAPSRGKP